MYKYVTRLLLSFCCLLIAACNDRNGMLPTSGGSPYEVTVVGDVDSILYNSLSFATYNYAFLFISTMISQFFANFIVKVA